MPVSPPTDDKPARLSTQELMEIYKVAVDEYRFQVNLNAARSRDYFVLNSAITAAAISLLGRSELLAGLVFFGGCAVAVLTALAQHTQHNYYRETRETKRQLEQRLGVELVTVRTTPSTGSRRFRIASVTNFNRVIVGMLCVVNLSGAILCARAFFSAPAMPAQRVVKKDAAKDTLSESGLARPSPSPTPMAVTSPAPSATGRTGKPGEKSP